MKKYKNKVTQAVIETAGVIKGGNWELVEDVQPTESIQEPDVDREHIEASVQKKASQKKTSQKKSGES